MANQFSLDKYNTLLYWSYYSFSVCDINNCGIARLNHTELSVIHIEVFRCVLTYKVVLISKDIQCYNVVLVFIIDVVIFILCIVLSFSHFFKYHIYGISWFRNYIAEIQIVDDVIYAHYLCFDSRFALYLRNGCANNLIKHNLLSICNAVNRTPFYVEILAGEFAHWQAIGHIEGNCVFIVAC